MHTACATRSCTHLCHKKSVYTLYALHGHRLYFALQQGLEIGERPVSRQRLALLSRRRLPICVRNLLPCVLIVMAIQTEQLPVAPIGGIIVVVVVFMMDREFAQFFAAKFASAPPTDPGIQLERLPPIGPLLLRLMAPRLSHNLILPVDIYAGLFRCHTRLLPWTALLSIIRHATVSHAEARRNPRWISANLSAAWTATRTSNSTS